MTMTTLTFRLSLHCTHNSRNWADSDIFNATSPAELLAGILDAVVAIRSRAGYLADRSGPLVLNVEREPTSDPRRWVVAAPRNLTGTLEEIGEEADQHAARWFAAALLIPGVIDYHPDEVPF